MRTFTITIGFGTTSDKQTERRDIREKVLNIGAAVIVIIGAILSLGAL